MLLIFCFIHLSLPLVLFLVKEGQSVSQMSKLRVNSLSIVYHCAIYNLPIFRGYSEGRREGISEDFCTGLFLLVGCWIVV